jgi:membrane associated rhomboid family serine protease
MQTCYRHTDRRAGVVCQRCDRPICPDCRRQASVGFHCPECTKQGAQKIVRPNQLLRPIVTQVLVGINLVIFALGIGAGLETRDRVIYEGGLVGLGYNPYTQELIGVATGQWYRIVTGGFLHANLIHVGFNMFILYRLGQVLEPALGRGRFLLVYFVSLVGGAFGVMIIDPNHFTVGASGAVFGIMGAAVAVFRSRGINVMDSGLGTTIVLNLALTFAIPGISIGGHVGGLIAGYVAGELLTNFGPRYLKDPALAVWSVVVLGFVLAGGAILVA